MKNYISVLFFALLLTLIVVPSQATSGITYEKRVDWSGVEFWLRLDLQDARITPSLDQNDSLRIPVEIEIIDMGGRNSVYFDKITFSGEHPGFESEYQLNSREFTHTGEIYNDVLTMKYDQNMLSWIKPGQTIEENIIFKIFGRVNELDMPAYSGIFRVPITVSSNTLEWDWKIKPDELGGIIYEYEPFEIVFTLKNPGKFPVRIRLPSNELLIIEPGGTYSRSADNFSKGIKAGNHTAVWRYKDDGSTNRDGYVNYITHTGYEEKITVMQDFTVKKRSFSWSVPEQIILSKNNSTINISGTILRARGNETLNVTILHPHGDKFLTRDVITQNGTFNFAFKPDDTGKWTITVKTLTDRRYESWTTYVEVSYNEERKISIRAYPVMFELNSPINVSGTITPYSDIIGDNISIFYVTYVNSTKFEEMHNVTVQEDGMLTDVFIPTILGNWIIKAVYGYPPCIMESQTLKVGSYGSFTISTNGRYFDLNEPVVVSILTEFKDYLSVYNQDASNELILAIIRPDGTTITENLEAEDGYTKYSFIPDQSGNWEVKFNWSGISNNFTFIVEDEIWEGPESNSTPGFEGMFLIVLFMGIFYLNKRRK